MFRATISHRSPILAGGVCALLAVAVAAATASSPAARASTDATTSTRASHANSPAAVIRPGRWAQVTTPLAHNSLIPEIGLARGADGVLHVLWLNGSGPWHIKDTPIAASGRVGKSTTLATDFLATDPDATATPSGVDAFWNGIKSDTPGSPDGTFVATRPRSGGSWSVSGSAIKSLPGVANTSSPDTATTGSDGKPWIAFYGTASMVVQHIGHPQVQINPKFKCCQYDAGLAVDGASGKTWITYLSLISHRMGIFARPLAATGKPSGPAVRLPASTAGGNVIPIAQRTAITGRGHGRAGVFALYGSGYPTFKSLKLIRLGTRSARTLATFGGPQHLAGSAITGDQSGRLWVAGFFGRGTKPGLFVRRSNTAARTFGPIEHVALPAGTTTVLKVYINARGGRLDVAALIAKHNNLNKATYYATEVLAPLALSATRSSRGGAKITFRVTDAGAAVKGATVRFCGKRVSTPKSGKVTIRVHSIARGSATASASKGGFAAARLKVRATC